jgi:hypothetical protein
MRLRRALTAGAIGVALVGAAAAGRLVVGHALAQFVDRGLAPAGAP